MLNTKYPQQQNKLCTPKDIANGFYAKQYMLEQAAMQREMLYVTNQESLAWTFPKKEKQKRIDPTNHG